MIRDSISDFIIRLKNGSMAKNASISVPETKLVKSVAEILFKEGYIGEISNKKKGDKKFLEIVLKYENGVPKIGEVNRMSKPSRRVYVGVSEIKPFKNGFGIVLLSTSKGIMTGQEARKQKLGGEYLFNIC